MGKWKIRISIVLALMLGFPFKWIFYKGEETGVSIFNIFGLGLNNLFFDFWLLLVNAIIIFFILSLFEKRIIQK